MRGYGKSQKAYEKAKKDYKKKTGFSTVGEKMRAERSGSNKDNDKERQQISKDLDKAQKQKDNTEKAKDQASLNVGAGTGSGMQTTDFIDDLKDAYKSGLFTGGTKTKAFMDKYNLDASDIVKLRVGIDQGLGTVISSSDRNKIGGNVLSDLVGDLRAEGILRTSGPGAEFLKQRASEIYEPGMSRFDKLPIYENPEGIFQTAANFTNQYNPILRGFDLLAGGSSQGMRGLYYGRNVLGLEGEDLDNFAASVANDRNLYNQMMNAPQMQDYQLNEFRAEANRNARAQMRGGDPNPISGTQPGEDDDDNTTDPGTDPDYTPPPQNFYTFFDPNLGRYRSGTYDEYLQYVTAKDGGIIQLQQGGALPNAPGGVLPQGRKTQLEDLFEARKEIQNLDTPTKSEAEGSRMIMADIDDKAKALSDKSKEGIMMAMTDQPAKDKFMANNPDIGPALRKDLNLFQKAGDSLSSLFMEAIRKGDITEGSANQYLEEALNNFVAAGIIPPNTSYDQLTDPFKDLITREAAMIARSENMRQEMSMFRDPKGKRGLELEEPIYKMQEGKPEDFEQIDPVMRDIDTRIMNRTFNRSGDMYEVADGGIIGLKQGGMNDMMPADELMFKDPSDKEEWEYNV